MVTLLCKRYVQMYETVLDISISPLLVPVDVYEPQIRNDAVNEADDEQHPTLTVSMRTISEKDYDTHKTSNQYWPRVYPVTSAANSNS